MSPEMFLAHGGHQLCSRSHNYGFNKNILKKLLNNYFLEVILR